MSLVKLLLLLPELTAQERGLLVRVASLLAKTDGRYHDHLEMELTLLEDAEDDPPGLSRTGVREEPCRVLAFPARAALPAPSPPPLVTPAILAALSVSALLDLPHATSHPFTDDDALHGAESQQRLLIVYEDGHANLTERHIELYGSDEEAALLAWCCTTGATRSFSMRRIRRWRWLPETFDGDHIVARYWREEGPRHFTRRIPWRCWRELQPVASGQLALVHARPANASPDRARGGHQGERPEEPLQTMDGMESCRRHTVPQTDRGHRHTEEEGVTIRHILTCASLALATASVLTTGCATIMSGPTQQMSFQSSPDGATVTIVRKPSPLVVAAKKPPDELILGTTPLTVQMLRTEFPQAVIFSKQGYSPVEMPLDFHLSGWFWGNILAGGFVGSTMDSISGSGTEYAPDHFFATLSSAQASAIERDTLRSHQEQTRLFIVRRYDSLISDLSRGHGEDLSAVFTLLSVDRAHEAVTRQQLSALAQRYPDPIEFATQVAARDGAAGGSHHD